MNEEFFQRTTIEVAENLLGMLLCRKMADESVQRCLIREVEVYDGVEDKASHAHKGKTKRNAVMFGPGGYWYVYLCYGMHWMLNLVTEKEGYPAAILIRGAGDYGGPGVLTKKLNISHSLNAKLCSEQSGLWIEKNLASHPYTTLRTPRIGIDYAGEWALAPLRLKMAERC
ncbi:MAG: hypothetical protein A2007_04305 [Verrucomicrobia bacterium GWC2_42_7]|nr:MAG: hypothetical protein A2007_04305 [Verrucomicrobia bacterium GWC2_42_7]